ncbi:MAG TPA: purine-nucleoside phosphorylase [Chitinophagales bacterium]|nr:purine-nucleoside phosphorylase [Chitinophagales bacterium]
MENLLKNLEETVAFIKSKTTVEPECGIVLGSGLGSIVDEMTLEASIEYKDIPHFPVSTVKGHSGKFCLGKWNGKSIVVMQGRFHYYEGYSLQQVTFPIRVMKLLGAKTIFITNAAGGLNPDIRIGELMVVTDHINLNSENPLRGPNAETLGPRFPDQHAIYNRQLIELALAGAKKHGITCHKGVYVGVTGPNFESPAEYRYMRIIGGDAVGMSTVPEVIVANHMGMKIFCISVICDEGNPAIPVSVTHDEVVKAAREAEPRIALILRELIESI